MKLLFLLSILALSVSCGVFKKRKPSDNHVVVDPDVIKAQEEARAKAEAEAKAKALITVELEIPDPLLEKYCTATVKDDIYDEFTGLTLRTGEEFLIAGSRTKVQYLLVYTEGGRRQMDIDPSQIETSCELDFLYTGEVGETVVTKDSLIYEKEDLTGRTCKFDVGEVFASLELGKELDADSYYFSTDALQDRCGFGEGYVESPFFHRLYLKTNR